MGEGICNAIAAVANFGKSIMEYVKQKFTAKNTPIMQQGQIAKEEQRLQDKTKETIANEDLDEERKQISE